MTKRILVTSASASSSSSRPASSGSQSAHAPAGSPRGRGGHDAAATSRSPASAPTASRGHGSGTSHQDGRSRQPHYGSNVASGSSNRPPANAASDNRATRGDPGPSDGRQSRQSQEHKHSSSAKKGEPGVKVTGATVEISSVARGRRIVGSFGPASASQRSGNQPGPLIGPDLALPRIPHIRSDSHGRLWPVLEADGHFLGSRNYTTGRDLPSAPPLVRDHSPDFSTLTGSARKQTHKVHVRLNESPVRSTIIADASGFRLVNGARVAELFNGPKQMMVLLHFELRVGDETHLLSIETPQKTPFTDVAAAAKDYAALRSFAGLGPNMNMNVSFFMKKKVENGDVTWRVTSIRSI